MYVKIQIDLKFTTFQYKTEREKQRNVSNPKFIKRYFIPSCLPLMTIQYKMKLWKETITQYKNGSTEKQYRYLS